MLLSSAVLLAKVKLVDDPPVAPKPKPGDVKGCITPADNILAITAVSRQTEKKYLPTSYDAKTGEFVFKNLPGADSYDICIATKDSREIQGIDLRFVDEYLLKLAKLRRKQLKLPEPDDSEKPFTKKDVDAIGQFIESWEDFMNQRRVLHIRGKGSRATVLIELMRTRKFHGSKKSKQKGDKSDDIVWRIELWYFTRAGGGWELVPNVERVLRRYRGKLAGWKKIDVTYYPTLSAYVDAQGKSKEIKFTIPAPATPGAIKNKNKNKKPGSGHTTGNNR
ncbi:MAG: hypothetical protein KAR11_05650 [Phycisphaerae bacterium]|nr:hypothetical protein [Phycisphaerae bacterium]